MPGFIFSSVMVLLSAIFGRFFCGWICPLGTLIDAGGKILHRNQKMLQSDKQNKKLSSVKFYFLGVIFVFAVFGFQVAWVLDPIVMLARVISLNIIPGTTWVLEKTFMVLIQRFELYGPVYDFYRDLRGSLLGVDVHFFSNSLTTFIVFLLIILATAFMSRLWCRMLCPLGALYGLISKFAFLERQIVECKGCGHCRDDCRMGAIKEDEDYVKGECILCMDCVYSCPTRATKFSWRTGSKQMAPDVVESEKGITRSEFLFLLGGLSLFGFKQKQLPAQRPVIRPPGALKEEVFLDACVRCGNCMKVCVTNGLQPVMLESGWQGVWTPQLVPEVGYCEYNCTLCGNVCPTGAIARLDEEKKRRTKLGTAKIDRSICLAWAYNKECIVCEEHCPVADKAIKTQTSIHEGKVIHKPYVDESKCVGCGICQNKCPVRPKRAIRVLPAK